MNCVGGDDKMTSTFGPTTRWRMNSAGKPEGAGEPPGRMIGRGITTSTFVPGAIAPSGTFNTTFALLDPGIDGTPPRIPVRRSLGTKLPGARSTAILSVVGPLSAIRVSP